MSTGDSYEDVRELAREVAETDDLSKFDWSLLYSQHYPTFTIWEADFDRLVERSDKSRDKLVEEFRCAYTDAREQFKSSSKAKSEEKPEPLRKHIGIFGIVQHTIKDFYSGDPDDREYHYRRDGETNE